MRFSALLEFTVLQFLPVFCLATMSPSIVLSSLEKSVVPVVPNCRDQMPTDVRSFNGPKFFVEILIILLD